MKMTDYRVTGVSLQISTQNPTPGNQSHFAILHLCFAKLSDSTQETMFVILLLNECLSITGNCQHFIVILVS